MNDDLDERAKFRVWGILLVDDLANGRSDVVRGFAQMLGAKDVSSNDLTIVWGTDIWPRMRSIEPKKHNVLTLIESWAAFERMRGPELPDLALLDICLDGGEHASRSEPGDWSSHEEIGPKFSEFAKLRIAVLQHLYEDYAQHFSFVDRMVSPSVMKTEEEKKIAASMRDDGPFRKECSAFLDRVEGEFQSRGETVRSHTHMGILNRGGVFLGELLRIRGAFLRPESPPEILFYSGSPFAQMSLLPAVINGREEMLPKAQFSFVPLVIAKLEAKAKAIIRKAAFADPIRVALLIDKASRALSKRSGSELKEVLCQKVIGGWSIGSLFPWRVVLQLGSTIMTGGVCEDEDGAQDFASMLRSLLPSSAAKARAAFTSYPWKNAFHPRVPVSRDGSADDDFARWGWEKLDIPGHLKALGDPNRNAGARAVIDSWMESNAGELAKMFAGIETNIEDEVREVKRRLRNLMSPALNGPVPDDPHSEWAEWPFESKLVRANVHKEVEKLLVRLPGIKRMTPSDRYLGTALKSEKIPVLGDPLFWFLIVPAVRVYFNLAPGRREIPPTTELPAAVLARLLDTLVAPFGDSLCFFDFLSQMESYGDGVSEYERSHIVLHAQVPGDLCQNPSQGLGGWSGALGGHVTPIRAYLSLRGRFEDGPWQTYRWSQEKDRGRMAFSNVDGEDPELAELVFPTDENGKRSTNFCWVLTLLTYRK